ncbi:type II secretion system protein N [Alteromonas sp. a30]|uniref:type II secretion system protein N n=1 Tax=Alteromonas sp. a30 TaxID=2730917 RepID=UPI00228033C8|nr:type II secretion system protein N [Alteromonas sp. a30]MCY7295662.1 type II secretion system protein N [Alteromonas sp. a30]
MELQQHKVKLIVVAVVFYLILVVANLPATQVINRIPLPSSISITGVNGTLWDGSADTVTVEGVQVESLHWDLSVFSLLIGKVSVDIHAGNANLPDLISFKGNVNFSLFSQTLDVQEGTLFLPTHLVLAQVPLPIPVRASGRFYLDASNITYSLKKNQCLAITANGGWGNAAVSGTTGMIDFGQFKAQIQCVEDSIQVQVNPENVLNLDVTATLSAQGQIKANGRFKPNETLPKEVHQAASLFGRADSQGYYSIAI